MSSSESSFLEINGLRYHLRSWGPEEAPVLFLLHGWADVSASFQFVVDALQSEWRVIAPDWRGFGESGWVPGGYWFADYLRDLDEILAVYTPDAPGHLIGHSMGGNIACLYAGVRPDRVATLMTFEGFGIPPATPDLAPARLRDWLEQSQRPLPFRDFLDFAQVAARIQRNSPRISSERAEWLARHWAVEQGDRVVLRFDPVHRRPNPVLYREQEAMACWREITAPVLWVDSEDSDFEQRYTQAGADMDARRGCFPQLQTATVTGAGHMMHHEQPEQVAALIEGFLRDQASRV
ncbi:MAG: alpha/beta hydrolase [Gammaproteobacteria bacterium]|nr:alpha/beta hydrolase [Gammaproteobacteria bacterium]